jgi:hypothetical protein
MVRIEVYKRTTPRSLVWAGRVHYVPRVNEYVAWDEGNEGGWVHSVEHLLPGGGQNQEIVVISLK